MSDDLHRQQWPRVPHHVGLEYATVKMNRIVRLRELEPLRRVTELDDENQDS